MSRVYRTHNRQVVAKDAMFAAVCAQRDRFKKQLQEQQQVRAATSRASLKAVLCCVVRRVQCCAVVCSARRVVLHVPTSLTR